MILPLLAALAIIIAASKLGGWLSGLWRQPVVLGELLVGLVLGPSVLGLFSLPYFEAAHVTDALEEFGELGVIFLMFSAGLEVQIDDLRKAGQPSIWAGVLGVVAPLVLGGAALLPFGYAFDQAVFLGLVMAATSVSISAQTLIELNRLRSVEGLTLLGAAVVDDVLAIAALSAFTALALGGEGGLGGLVWTLLRMALFLVGSFVLGSRLLPRAVDWVEERQWAISEPVLSLVVVMVLAFAWASEFVGGVAAITGAFIAGVALARSSLKGKIERGMHVLAYAFFVPIFLVGIGLQADARALSAQDLGLTVWVVALAVVTKLLGAGAGALLGGLKPRSAWRVGIGMISRGEVGLIVASVGVTTGLLDGSAFTAVVMMVLATTIVTPPLLRWAFREPAAPPKEDIHA